eukprot:1145264-Pelagomonas_calceolata.AAC.2
MVLTTDGRVRVWDVAQGKLKLEADAGPLLRGPAAAEGSREFVEHKRHTRSPFTRYLTHICNRIKHSKPAAGCPSDSCESLVGCLGSLGCTKGGDACHAHRLASGQDEGGICLCMCVCALDAAAFWQAWQVLTKERKYYKGCRSTPDYYSLP